MALVQIPTPAAGGMTLLSTTSVGTSSSVSISGISQAYRNLYFVFREIRIGGAGLLYVRINGNSATASHSFLTITGSSVTSNDATWAPIGEFTNNNTILNGTLTIPDYANTTLNSKPFNADTTNITIGVATGPRRITIGASNGNTANGYVGTGAVTSVTFLTDGAFNFTSGNILLYGVN